MEVSRVSLRRSHFLVASFANHSSHVLQYLVRVRNDLEKVRMLTELVRKREKEKLRQAQILKQVLDSVLFPHDTALRLCMEKISR